MSVKNVKKQDSPELSLPDECANSSKLFEKIIWRIDDVARHTGWLKKYIYNLTAKKDENGIPAIKKGRTLFFIPDDFLEWIKEGN